MSFGFKTPNTRNEFQKKRIFVGYDLETEQVYIYIVFSLIAAWFAILPTVSIFWKVIVGLLLFRMAKTLASMKNGRTYWKLFRMWIRKKTTGNISVDRGADYSYFKRKQR